MLQVLTDEEAIAHSDELVARVAQAFIATRMVHPGASIEALSQVLYMVNGQNWMAASDMARARVRAKTPSSPESSKPRSRNVPRSTEDE